MSFQSSSNLAVDTWDALPEDPGRPQGGVDRYNDQGAFSGETYRYRLIEEDVWGDERIHGPFEVTVDGDGAEPGDSAGGADGGEAIEVAQSEGYRALACQPQRRGQLRRG